MLGNMVLLMLFTRRQTEERRTKGRVAVEQQRELKTVFLLPV